MNTVETSSKNISALSFSSAVPTPGTNKPIILPQTAVAADPNALKTHKITAQNEMQSVRCEIEGHIKKHCADWTQDEMEEGITVTLNSYMQSKTEYGPVARAWTESLIEKANHNKMKLVFMARDGIVPYKIAKKLMAQEEYQKKYPNLVGNSQIVLGYFSRAVVATSQNNSDRIDLFKEYAEKELGITDGSHCLFVDVGFCGSMINTLRDLLPKAKLDFNYLISMTNQATGFVPVDTSFAPSHNCGVHWLEDTHQGNLESPTELVRASDGHVYANTAVPGKKRYLYPVDHLQHLVRKFSQKAVVRSYQEEPVTKEKLDTTLAKFPETIKKIQECAMPLFATHQTAAKPHYRAIFDSPIMDAYILQLDAHINESLKRYPVLSTLTTGEAKNELEKLTLELISLIHNFKSKFKRGVDARQFHQQFVRKLRELVDKKNVEKASTRPATLEAIQFIESLSAFVYTGFNLMPAFKKLLAETIPAGAISELEAQSSSYTLPDWILIRYMLLKRQFPDPIQSASKEMFDPRKLGDLPSVFFEFPAGGKKVTIIRTPAVVKDQLRDNKTGDLLRAQVTDEFIGFLDDLRRNKKTHLYVNLMNPKRPAELTRTECIEEMQKKYSDTINVMTLSKDSDFYRQSGEFSEDSVSFSDFKEQFLTEMFNGSGSFRWPAALTGNAWVSKCSAALDKVHKDHFKSCSEMDQSTRKDFIEIAYIEIIEAAMEHLKPDSCNVSCLLTVDRGAATLSELYIKSCKKDNAELNAEQKKNVAAMMLIPAILSENRTMEVDRMNRFFTATKCMFS